MRPDPECRCNGSQGRCGGATFHGSLADTDDKRAVTLAANPGMR